MKPSIKLDSATARPAASARPGRLNYAGLVLLPLLLAMGVAFRVAGIDKKLYWHDEAYTSLRASGYTADEAIAHLFTGDEIGIADIQKYQRYAAEKGLRDTISSLVTEDSEHPPFYFLLVRLWMKWFGDSPGIVRGLSVIFSLLVFPSLYWLCMELFGSRATAWTAVALMAVSPFHVLFAQEARQYSLWALTILVSSAALLRARRLPAKLNWGAYAVAATLGLYTHLFFGFVLVAHALYMAANEGLRLSRTMMSYALACFASLLAFSPWIVLLIQDFNRIVAANEWAYVEADLSYLIDSWILYFSSPFVDYSSGGLAGSLMRVSALALAACSLYHLFRRATREVWSFVFTLILVTGLALMLPDLISGGVRSATGRFLVPCYIGLQLSVAYSLSVHTASASERRRRIGQVLTLMLVMAGVASCAAIYRADAWWNKDTGRVNAQVAQTINRSHAPLLILSDPYPTNLGDVLSLSHMLDPKVRLRLVRTPDLPEIPEGFIEVFLFNPTEELRQRLEQERYRLEALGVGALYRVAD